MRARLKTVTEVQSQRTRILDYAYYAHDARLFNNANTAYKNIAIRINRQRGYTSNFLLNDYDSRMYCNVIFKTN